LKELSRAFLVFPHLQSDQQIDGNSTLKRRSLNPQLPSSLAFWQYRTPLTP
jgi:hypothetical protein